MKVNKEEFKLSIELMRSFRNVQKKFIRAIQRTAGSNGLSVPEYQVLMSLMHQQKMNQKDILEKTYLPKSTLSKAIDGLVQSGLLERKQTEDDRRGMEISISEKGRKVVTSILMQEDGIYQSFHQAVKKLTEEQSRDLIHMHEQIATYFEEREKEIKC